MVRVFKFFLITVAGILAYISLQILMILAGLGVGEFYIQTPTGCHGSPLASMGVAFINLLYGCSGLILLLLISYCWLVAYVRLFKPEFEQLIDGISRIRITTAKEKRRDL